MLWWLAVLCVARCSGYVPVGGHPRWKTQMKVDSQSLEYRCHPKPPLLNQLEWQSAKSVLRVYVSGGICTGVVVEQTATEVVIATAAHCVCAMYMKCEISTCGILLIALSWTTAMIPIVLSLLLGTLPGRAVTPKRSRVIIGLGVFILCCVSVVTGTYVSTYYEDCPMECNIQVPTVRPIFSAATPAICTRCSTKYRGEGADDVALCRCPHTSWATEPLPLSTNLTLDYVGSTVFGWCEEASDDPKADPQGLLSCAPKVAYVTEGKIVSQRPTETPPHLLRGDISGQAGCAGGPVVHKDAPSELLGILPACVLEGKTGIVTSNYIQKLRADL